VTLPDADSRSYFGVAFAHAELMKSMRCGHYICQIPNLGATLLPPPLIEAVEKLEARGLTSPFMPSPSAVR
jgi:hypothetical protein